MAFGARINRHRKRASLFLLPHDAIGGAERVVQMLMEVAARERDEVHLIFLSKQDRGYWRRVPENVTLHFTNASSARFGLWPTARLIASLSRRHEIVEAVSSHSHTNGFMGLLRRLGVLRCRRQIMRESTLIARRYRGRMLRMVKMLYWAGYDAADLIICQTHLMKQELIATVPQARKWNIRVMPNPFKYDEAVRQSQEKVTPAPEQLAPYLVSAGRLIPEKGMDVLIRAFGHVKARCPALKLLILGEGRERPALKALAAELDLAKDVVMPGYVHNPFPYLARAEAGVIASRVEGFPNVLLESMAVCRAVVSTRCAGGIEQLEGILTCETEKPRQLARTLLKALQEENALPAKMKREVQGRTPEQYWRQIVNPSGETGRQ